jgi:hypothetical protein
MLNDYARKNTANNRSLALERILREWQAWDNDVKEDIKESRAAALANINKELGIE